jgi:hypothetical protein
MFLQVYTINTYKCVWWNWLDSHFIYTQLLGSESCQRIGRLRDCRMAAPAPHLFLLPSLGIGHLIPFTELAKRLAARRFLVSFFVSSDHGLSIARNKIADAANIRIVELHLSHQINTEASDSKSYASDQILLLNHTLLQDAFQKLLMSEENENGFRLMYPPPLCIVTDFLLSWTVTMAAKLGIPRVNVECSPAPSALCCRTLF